MGRKISDYISGLLVNEGGEERITQVLSRHLVEDLGYDRRQIRTRPQWRVPKSPSGSRRSGWPVDVVVFGDSDSYDDPAGVYMIFDCKAASHRFTQKDEEQIQQYLINEPQARLGILFNGLGTEGESGQTPRVFHKRVKRDGSMEFRELSSFPRAGDLPDLGEKGRLRKELEKAPNLRAIFRDIRNYIHSYDSRSRRDEEIIREIVRLLLCKIYDEDRGPDEVLRFRWISEDDDQAVGRRLRKLYQEVRAAYPEIFEDDETDIRLDDASIRYVVQKLQRYELTNSERHAIGDAFEVFIGDALKGKEGQYFTPRNVAETMVDFLDSSADIHFVDPACGTGGFLVSMMGHVYEKLAHQLQSAGRSGLIAQKQRDWARSHLRGVDRDSLCIKFSKAYTALLGDGHTGLFREDSIDFPSWPPEMKRHVRMGSFDVVLTNPPFGRGLVKEGDILRHFELGHHWKRDDSGDWIRTDELRKKQELGLLFLELCLQLLKPGGRLGIVLLESHLGTQTDAYVAAWLLENFTVLGVVDLPDTTFQPHTHAKTCILFIEKAPPRKAYEILMAEAKWVGHDSRGNTIYRQDEDFRTLLVDGEPVVADDLADVRKQLRALKAGREEESEYGFRVLNTDLEDFILIPRYYDRSFRERLRDWADDNDCELVSPKQLIEEGVIQVLRGHGGMSSQWYTTEPDAIPYVRTSNISGLEIEYQSRHLVRVPEEIYRRKIKKVKMRANDILFVRRGEDRIGDVAIVYPGFEKILVAGEIDIVRLADEENRYGLTPFALLYLLSHPHVRAQFWHKVFYETIIWNISDRWRDILLPLPRSAAMMQTISERVGHIVEQRRHGLEEMRDLYLRPVLPIQLSKT